jgi:hypothetical protein
VAAQLLPPRPLEPTYSMHYTMKEFGLYRELLAESGIPYSQQLDLLGLFDERLSRAR